MFPTSILLRKFCYPFRKLKSKICFGQVAATPTEPAYPQIAAAAERLSADAIQINDDDVNAIIADVLQDSGVQLCNNVIQDSGVHGVYSWADADSQAGSEPGWEAVTPQGRHSPGFSIWS